MEKGKRLFFERYPSPWRLVLLSMIVFNLMLLFFVGIITLKSKGSSFTMYEYYNNIIVNVPQLCILNIIGAFVITLRFFVFRIKYGVYENGIEVDYRFVKWQDIAEVVEMKNFQIKPGPNNSILAKLTFLGLSSHYKGDRLIMFDKQVTYYGIRLRNGLFLIFPTTRKDEFENAIKQAGYEKLLNNSIKMYQ
ncbi:hypothetical protein J7K41_00435 [Candidatus Micrarchaeota archaeon]|nr:hypothetical protein [Candidatus Micrarchaeota archaeon]